MKYLKRFIENKEDDLDIFREIFSDIVDLQHDYYRIQNGDDTHYSKVFSVDFEITKNNNILVKILADNMYAPAIINDIKSEIKPSLTALGYKIAQIKNIKTGPYTLKTIPSHGYHGVRLTTVQDPKNLISVLIK